MDDNQIISAAVDALTGKMIYSFTLVNKCPEYPPVIPDPKRTIWDKLFRRPIVKAVQLPQPDLERTFEIWPCVAANQLRIAAKALSLPVDLFDKQAKMLAYIPEHLPTMIYIIAAAVQNNFKEPEQELITYIERNIDNLDIMHVLGASLQNTNMEAFTHSIVLMSGPARIVQPKASPLDGRELIASHTQE